MKDNIPFRKKALAEQSGSVLPFRRRDDSEELARINRLTGLEFESVPESLIQRIVFRRQGGTAAPRAAKKDVAKDAARSG